MPGPRFRTDDGKLVFNDFGKPIIQVGLEAGPKCLCCEKCEQYLQCFNRVPLAVDLAGLNFSKWIEWAQFVWNVGWQRERTGNFTGSDPDGHSEFVGRFIFHPRDNRLACGGQRCFDDGEVSDCRNYCGTHHSTYYRTVNTPGNPDWPNKKVSLFAYVTCCHVDDNPELESTGVKFGVMLQIEGEGGVWGWGPDGDDWSWWHTPASWIYNAQCCPILETNCIPWEDLDPNDWSNLQELPLNPLARWWYNNESTPEPDIIGCEFYSWSWYGCESICTSENYDTETGECDICETCTDPVEECPNGSLEIGSVGGVLCGGLSYTDFPVCIPEPIRLLDPNENYISVLGNCRPKDCANCDPPTEWEGPKPPATTVEINFTAEGGCGKLFTAIYPDCLEVAEINWSFGKTGPVVSHYIRNLVGNSDTEYGEIVTLTIVDVRGCVYTYCRLVTCGCCSGASGSLSIEPGEFDCCYVLTASVTNSGTGACEGHAALIEYQVLEPGTGCAWESYEGCACDDPECGAACGRQFLSDGQFANVCVDRSAQVRWRAWDKSCGCAGPWNYEDLPCQPCEFCDGKYDGFDVTISSVADCADESSIDCNCLELNREYRVPKTGPCQGEAEFEILDCTLAPSTPATGTYTVGWEIIHVEGEGEGYYLRLFQSIDLSGAGNGTFVDVFISEEMPTCADISECGIIDQEVVFCLVCDNQTLNICATAYAA